MTEEEMAYKMPKVDTGCTVKVFPHGNETEKPHFAHVARCNDRSIDAKGPFDQARGGIRHITDPLLKSRDQEFRSSCGAWDFTDETKAAKTAMSVVPRMEALEARVKVLEELLDK